MNEKPPPSTKNPRRTALADYIPSSVHHDIDADDPHRLTSGIHAHQACLETCFFCDGPTKDSSSQSTYVCYCQSSEIYASTDSMDPHRALLANIRKLSTTITHFRHLETAFFTPPRTPPITPTEAQNNDDAAVMASIALVGGHR